MLHTWTIRLQVTVILLQRIVWTWVVSSLGSDDVVEAALGLGVKASSRTRTQHVLHVTSAASTTFCLGLCVTCLALCALSFIRSCCIRLLPRNGARHGEHLEMILRRTADFFLLPPGLQPTCRISYVISRHLLKFVLFNLLAHGAQTAVLKAHFVTWDSFYNSLELARLVVAWYILFSTMIVHFFAFKIVARMCTDDGRRRFMLGGSTRGWASFHFSLSNVITGMVYYARLYDPKGTRKPQWTENLG